MPSAFLGTPNGDRGRGNCAGMLFYIEYLFCDAILTFALGGREGSAGKRFNRICIFLLKWQLISGNGQAPEPPAGLVASIESDVGDK